jgi:hypothetical protein
MDVTVVDVGSLPARSEATACVGEARWRSGRHARFPLRRPIDFVVNCVGSCIGKKPDGSG